MTSLQKPLALAVGLAAASVLTSCSQPGTGVAPTTSPAASTGAPAVTNPAQASTPPSSPTGRRIDISVKGKRVTPAPATVNIAVGESLTIALTSDHDDKLHAHGFEIAKDVKAGKPVQVTIKGAEPGVYEFELHNPELRLFQVAVR